MTNLFTESGGSEQDRYNEARRILYDMGLVHQVQIMNEKERDFVQKTADNMVKYQLRTLISAKALFWLRDLKDKYVG